MFFFLQLPWDNYRLSHSDGKPYGDLDPRFLDDVNMGDNPFRTAETSQGTLKSNEIYSVFAVFR